MSLQECKRCQSWCCKGENPYASQEELKKLGVKEIASNDDGACIFLINGQCDRYEDRPFECRIFPLDIIEEQGKLLWIRWDICKVQPGKPEDFEESFDIDYIKSYADYHKLHQPEKYSEVGYEVLREVNSRK